MDIALKIGDLNASIQQGETCIKKGEVGTGIRMLLGVCGKIREYEGQALFDSVQSDLAGKYEKCYDLLLKGAQALPATLTRPVVHPPGWHQLVNVEQLIMPPDDDIFLDDIVGMEEAKQALVQAVLLPNVFAGMLPVEFQWRGILLFGASGVGKSKVVRAFVNSLAKTTTIQVTFLNVTLDQICGSYHGQTEKNLSAIFKAAESKSPTILLVDEIDAICGSRENDKRQGEIKMTNHFLTILDGLKAAAPVVVIGTTNKVYTMDHAFYRRFQKLIYVELPNKSLREKLLKNFVNRIQPEWMSYDIDFSTLAEDTCRYSPADLKTLVAYAAQEVRSSKISKQVLKLMEVKEQISFENVRKGYDSKKPITYADLVHARQKTRATNSDAEVTKLDTFADMFCDRNSFDGDLPGDCECCTRKECEESPSQAILTGTCVFMRFLCGEFM